MKKEENSVELEVRRARILGLHSKGLTQMEIERELGIHQSTISRDLRYIKQEAKKKKKSSV